MCHIHSRKQTKNTKIVSVKWTLMMYFFTGFWTTWNFGNPSVDTHTHTIHRTPHPNPNSSRYDKPWWAFCCWFLETHQLTHVHTHTHTYNSFRSKYYKREVDFNTSELQWIFFFTYQMYQSTQTAHLQLTLRWHIVRFCCGILGAYFCPRRGQRAKTVTMRATTNRQTSPSGTIGKSEQILGVGAR